jgi:hypothetical protein
MRSNFGKTGAYFGENSSTVNRVDFNHFTDKQDGFQTRESTLALKFEEIFKERSQDFGNSGWVGLSDLVDALDQQVSVLVG